MAEALANFVARVPAGRCPAVSVESTYCSGNVLVTIRGKLDKVAAAIVDEVLAIVVHRPTTRTVDVDLSGVQFVDAAGLHCLTRARREAATSACPFNVHLGDIGTARDLLHLPHRAAVAD